MSGLAALGPPAGPTDAEVLAGFVRDLDRFLETKGAPEYLRASSAEALPILRRLSGPPA